MTTLLPVLATCWLIGVTAALLYFILIKTNRFFWIGAGLTLLITSIFMITVLSAFYLADVEMTW